MGDDDQDFEDLDSTEIDPLSPSALPERIGPYRILQHLGEGGMGVVYLAEQTEPVRRKVALKVIKHGMDTKQVVARFDAERQALAMMDHPCVAKVFDAGSTENGRPYFVMEYVRGVPITEHCDRQRLSTAERLALFRQVCEGVQHAHQKAIIHRDLKPSNVLVSYVDGRTTPKIIDFGVAKATEHRLTEKTLFTELGVLIGTPEYMSPEQAEMTGQNVDTRTDVYSLGVMLYELLVGALPFESKELRGAGFDEIRRKIRQEEPSKPSRRLSTFEELTDSAKARRTDPGTLRRQLSGDLDWITMRALEKDRGRRYSSPSELAADIERHLNQQPVVARRPSLAYRFEKFTLRHRVGVAVGVALLILAGVFAIVMVWQTSRLQAAWQSAQREGGSFERLLTDLEEPASGKPVDRRFDLDRIAPLGSGEKNAAIWFADFVRGGPRIEEWREARKKLGAKLAPDAPLLLEAEEWVNQGTMRFYPDIWSVSGPAGNSTRLPNALMILDLSKAWVARGDANDGLEGALEDYRRAVRLGRLLSQDDLFAFNNRIGGRCMRMGLESMLRRLQMAGDQARADQVALALSQVIGDRLASTIGYISLDLRPYVRVSWFKLRMDLPDWKLDIIVNHALGSPRRDMRHEAAVHLCVIQELGSPGQQRRARETLDRLAGVSDPLLATMGDCSRSLLREIDLR